MGIILNKATISKINGVLISSLKQIIDERGAVLHMLRSDDPQFIKFGEIYFSEINHGEIKAWKRHKIMTQNFVVPVGRIRLVLFDDRFDSTSQGKIEEIILGRPDSYYRVFIPPMIWYGFKGISDYPAIIANCTDIPHNTRESENHDVTSNYFPYRW